MMRNKTTVRGRVLALILLAMVGLATGAPARADTIYSTLNYGVYYYWGSAQSVTGYGTGFSGYANAFVSPGNYRLDAVTLAVGLNSGTNSLQVLLMTSSPSGPTTILESWVLTNAMGPYGPTWYPPQQANSVLHPFLSASTQYWLVALPGASDTNAGWYYNSVAGFGQTAYGGGAWGTDPSTWGWTVYPWKYQAAFAIEGTPASPVPEPGTMEMLGMGLLALASAVRMRIKA